MSEHTKGRLVVKDEWLIPEAHADRMIGSSTDKAQEKANYAHTVAIIRGKYQDDKANSRRLAAAWNACEGMQTDDIEELAACQGVTMLTVYADDLRKELDAARALLRGIVDGFDVVVSEMRADGDEPELEAHLAIQKIRNFLRPAPPSEEERSKPCTR